jgi:hypothetical protein
MSNTPISVDLPHQLGAAEAKRRIDGGIGRLKDFIPGGGAEVRAAWTGDRLGMQVVAMGQEVNAQLDVHETFVRVDLLLPPELGFFRPIIEAAVSRKGADLLEDKRGAGH